MQCTALSHNSTLQSVFTFPIPKPSHFSGFNQPNFHIRQTLVFKISSSFWFYTPNPSHSQGSMFNTLEPPVMSYSVLKNQSLNFSGYAYQNCQIFHLIHFHTLSICTKVSTMLTTQLSASTIVALFNLPLIPNYDFLIEDSRHCFERAAARKLILASKSHSYTRISIWQPLPSYSGIVNKLHVHGHSI